MSQPPARASGTVRGDSLLAAVKPGGGGFRGPWYCAYQLAAGAIVAEAVLARAVLVESGKLRPGPGYGEGALATLAGRVEAEPRAHKLRRWLEETGPWAQQAIGEELAAAGFARLERRRFLGIFLHQPYLVVLDRGAQDDVYAAVRDTLQGEHGVLPEQALLVLLLGPAAMLQYHVRTTRGRRMRRRLRELHDLLPEGVQAALRAYEKWNVSDPGS